MKLLKTNTGLRLAAGTFIAAGLLALTSCKPRPPEPERVAKARARCGAEVKRACRAAGVSYPPNELYLRAFKKEGILECWARGKRGGPYKLVKSYAIRAGSGVPGPKRREGDLQVPEGFYHIDLFNPESSFHLSMRVDYPNASDRILSDPERPGFDIYLHGGSASVGCVALGDDPIEEAYLLALDASRSGRPIPIHLFPARMSGPEWEKFRASEIAERPELAAFWASLEPAYLSFERTRTLPAIEVAPDGRYVVR